MMTHPHYLTLSLLLFFYSRNQMSFLHIIDNMCGRNNIEEGGTCTTMYTKYEMKFPKWSGDYKRSLDSIESLYLPESESISISEINRIQEYTEMFLDRYDMEWFDEKWPSPWSPHSSYEVSISVCSESEDDSDNYSEWNDKGQVSFELENGLSLVNIY